jgi:NAD-dependent SIR2 family protein deacetylase
LLSEKGLLHTHFTQNIDTLERRAGVPDEDIIEAHGSFATSRCIDCMKPYDSDKMKEVIRDKSIPRCPHCEGLVKPGKLFSYNLRIRMTMRQFAIVDIVFFGEAVNIRLEHLRHI